MQLERSKCHQKVATEFHKIKGRGKVYSSRELREAAEMVYNEPRLATYQDGM